ncbi:hypothetical protein CYMTET_25023 [Cymbomonas tetramitiformis]|uniref:Uncharacterized protein n=1 Tax=Cymbomonas tetramitiformis TaxID=36881 RepID=A0AAE0FUX1_9CHLO|nr:hypothetical protein CYMTET_25023 [Cymbomonas tetramitiformis]
MLWRWIKKAPPADTYLQHKLDEHATAKMDFMAQQQRQMDQTTAADQLYDRHVQQKQQAEQHRYEKYQRYFADSGMHQRNN